VDKSATDQMLPFLPSLEHHELACARHEIMQETPEILATAWAHIDGFLARL
jgi:alpha-beta hydrolase superfamily lysophospholipase